MIATGTDVEPGLSDGEVTRVFRSATGGGIGVAAVALALGAVFGHLLVGVGVAAGMLLGILNAYGLRSMSTKVASVGGRKRFALTSSMRRLGLITVVVFGLVLANKFAGLACLGGLGAFQLFLLIASSGAMLRAMKQSAAP